MASGDHARGGFEMRLGLAHAPPQERGRRKRPGVLGAAALQVSPHPDRACPGRPGRLPVPLCARMEGREATGRSRGQASKGGRAAEPSSVDGHTGPEHQLRQLAVSRRAFRKEIEARAPRPLIAAWEEMCDCDVRGH